MSAGGIVWLNTRRSREGSFVTRRGNRGTSSRITESAEEKSRQESGLSCPGSSFGEESLHWYGAELRPPGIATWKIAMISGFSSGLAMSGTLNGWAQPEETKRGGGDSSRPLVTLSTGTSGKCGAARVMTAMAPAEL